MHATIVVAILSAAPATKAGLLLRPLSAFLALRIPPASSGRREACSLLTRSAAAGIACCTASRIFSPLPSVAEPPPIFPVLAAQSELSWVSNKDDVDTFVVMVEMGLPSTGRLCTPPIIQFNLFKTIEASLPEEKAGPFMDAAVSCECKAPCADATCAFRCPDPPALYCLHIRLSTLSSHAMQTTLWTSLAARDDRGRHCRLSQITSLGRSTQRSVRRKPST